MTRRRMNGDGSVYFSESENRWRAEIHWTDKSGKENVKKFSGQKKQTVINKLSDFKKTLSVENGNISNTGISFQTFADAYLSSTLVNTLKPSSYDRLQRTLAQQVYPFIGHFPVGEITHYDIQNLINSLAKSQLSYSTVKKAYDAVNSVLRAYRIRNHIPFNPCEEIILPHATRKDTSDIKYFDEQQCRAIIKEATSKYSSGRPVHYLGYGIVLLMFTGLRVGELLALTWDDIDFKNKTIAVTKNTVVVQDKTADYGSRSKIINQNSPKTFSGNRIIPMTEMAYKSLWELYRLNGDYKYIMTTQNKVQAKPNSVTKMMHSILIRSGIAVDKNDTAHLCGVHALRHTFATMLFRNGANVKTVSEILGHSSTKITENIYIHIIQEQKVKAIETIDKYADDFF